VSENYNGVRLTQSEKVDTHLPFRAEGGYYREEAIMLLRRFYMSENQNGSSEITQQKKGSITELNSAKSKEKDITRFKD
jgi:hypothetical protein